MKYFFGVYYIVIFSCTTECETKPYTNITLKIPKKLQIQQIALDDSSDNDSKDFIELYRKCTAMHYTSVRQSIAFLKESIGRSIESSYNNR